MSQLGAFGVQASNQVESLPSTYGQAVGNPVRMGMRPVRTNPCGCAGSYGGDCDCAQVRTNPDETEDEGFLAKYKWYLAGAAVLGYLYYTKR